MADRSKGEVSIRLDKTRTLRLSINAQCQFEEAVGRTWDSLLFQIEKVRDDADEIERAHKMLEIISPLILRAILWACLLHEDPKITLEQVGEIMEYAEGETFYHKRLYIWTKIQESWIAGMPDAAKKKINEEVLELKRRNGLTSEASLSPQPDGELMTPGR